MAESRADTATVAHYPHPPAASTSNVTDSKWGPYSSFGDFGANMAIVLASLFCTTLLAFSLAAAVRLLLRRLRRRCQPLEKPEMEAELPVTAPALVFSARGTKLAGAAPECAICLAEFAEGDAVRVLPACGHGFHVLCVEQWLVTRRTCPTCRRTCRDEEVKQSPVGGQEPAQLVLVGFH
ncbi:RING-H2 finger protein ATL79-like [Zingiber officinale]|uniref:RING-type domain-containing protein n=1 Tax=Zingiber officinale TaxID=94328 RepID=A0A8J5IHQ2_ZINOF|nr:RING-H2 finger protein ATL79-like [Zingiber officinale]KAG6534244.1 hypothetical protein ZIOFF_008130 [Zingiber officinale]